MLTFDSLRKECHNIAEKFIKRTKSSKNLFEVVYPLVIEVSECYCQYKLNFESLILFMIASRLAFLFERFILIFFFFFFFFLLSFHFFFLKKLFIKEKMNKSIA